MADGSVSVELSVDEQKALRALTSLSKKFDDLGETAKKSFGKGDAALASFAGNLAAGAVLKGFALVGDAFKGLINNVDSFIKAASIQEQATNSLNVALAATGKFSKKASDDFHAYASAMQTATGVGDEAILKIGSRIQLMSKLSVEDLKKASTAAIQLSAAYGIDLDAAAIKVAKSIEGKSAALGKLGINVKKGTSETEQFNNTISALASLSGSAEAKLNTFGGASAALSGRVGDLQESLGNLVIKNPAVIAAISAMDKGVLFLDQTIQKNSGSITGFVEGAVIKLIESLKTAADVFAFFNNAIAGTQIASKLLESAFFSIDIAISQFGLGLDGILEKVQKFTGLDLGAGQKAYTDLQNASIENSKVQQQEIDKEINAIVNRTNVQNRAAKEFANVVVDSTKSAIEQQKSLTETGNTARLEAMSINAQNQKNIEAEKITAIDLLHEAKMDRDLQRSVDFDNMKLLKDEETFLQLEAGLGREAALQEVYKAQQLEKEKNHAGAVQSIKAAQLKAEQGMIINQRSWENQSNKEKLASTQAALGQISTLMQSSNKELFMIGKAAAITTATIDGWVAVQKTYASLPFPANGIAATLVAVATAANVAKIASQQPPKFAQGGFVGGSSFSGDRVPALVNSGEAILNTNQQREFMKVANGEGSNNGIMEAINKLGDRIQSMSITVQADGREIARLVRDQRASGFSV